MRRSQEPYNDSGKPALREKDSWQSILAQKVVFPNQDEVGEQTRRDVQASEQKGKN
jgi:hypothetical protein